MGKRFDVVAKVGEYQDRNGETKPRWKNVGAVITTDNGHALLLDKTFNPAGLAEPGRESVLLSLFEPKDRDQSGGQGAPNNGDPYSGGEQVPF